VTGRRGGLALGLLLVLGGGPVAWGRAEKPLILVLTPSRDPGALKEAGDPLAKTLTRVSGVPVTALVASDYVRVVEALLSRRVGLAFVHPVGYVLTNREAGCQILVRDGWQGKTAYTARFYVRKDCDLRRVEDLRGKTVAFVDPASFSGHIYPARHRRAQPPAVSRNA
jgi:phosphonate transport system substrate-binding protein